MEKIIQDSGVLVQPYWRSTFRHMTADVHGLVMHPTFEIHLEKTWLDRPERPAPPSGPAIRRRPARATEARMLVFLLKRLGVMVLTALCLTLIVFALVNLKPNLVKLAKEQTGSRITEQQVEVWLDQNGYNRPFLVRYGEWLGGVVRGDLGHSTRFNAPVADVLWPRLWLTGEADVLGDGGDGAGGAAARRPRGHARGVGAGPGAVDRRDRDHLDAGIRLGRGADGDLRQPDGRAAMVLRLAPPRRRTTGRRSTTSRCRC